jgi:hypothetical protein
MSILRRIAALFVLALSPFALSAQGRQWVEIGNTNSISGIPSSSADPTKDAPIVTIGGYHRGSRGPFYSYIMSTGDWVVLVPMQDGSLYRSNNGGTSFTQVKAPGSAKISQIQRLPNGVLYMCTIPATGELDRYNVGIGNESQLVSMGYSTWRSIDDGVTWTNLSLANTMGAIAIYNGNTVQWSYGEWFYSAPSHWWFAGYYTYNDPGRVAYTGGASDSQSFNSGPSGDGPVIYTFPMGEESPTGSWQAYEGIRMAGGCGGGGGDNLWTSIGGDALAWCNFDYAHGTHDRWARGGSVQCFDGSNGLLTLSDGASGPGPMNNALGRPNLGGATPGYDATLMWSVAGLNNFMALTYGGNVWTTPNGTTWNQAGTTFTATPFGGANIGITQLDSVNRGDTRLFAVTQDAAGDNLRGGTRLWVWDTQPTAPGITMYQNGTAKPDNLAACSSDNITFKVTTTSTDADATDTLVYQWQQQVGTNWNDIPGATGTSYSLTAGTAPGRYRVVVMDVYHGKAMMRVPSTDLGFNTLAAPGFSSVPNNQSVCDSTPVTLTYRIGGPAGATMSVSVQENGTAISGVAPATVQLDNTGYAGLNVSLPASRIVNTQGTGANNNLVYTVTITVTSGGCGTSVSPGVTISVLPRTSTSLPAPSSYSGCANSTYILNTTRTVVAASGSAVSYRLVNGAQSISLSVLPSSGPALSYEQIGNAQILSGGVSLAGDLSGVTTTTTFNLVADVSGPCGGGSTQSTWSMTVTPPATWNTYPSSISNRGVSGFANTNAMTAAMNAGGQPVTWAWQMAALNTNPASDYVVSPAAGPWSGVVNNATSTASTFTPAYFAASGSQVPNGSFEQAVNLGVDVTLNGGAAGLSIDTTTGSVTPYANKATTASPQTVAHGSRSLKIAANGALRVAPNSAYLTSVSADSTNVAGDIPDSKTIGWLVLADFAQNGGSPTFQWQVEAFGADRLTSTGTVTLDSAPVPLPASGWTTWGYLVKPSGATNGVNLPSGTSFFRPVIQVSGTNGSTAYLRVDDVRVVPISASEEALLRAAGALNASNQVVPPTITALLGVDGSGNNLGQTTVSRYYQAVPTEASPCGANPSPSNAATATSESRLVVLRSPYNALAVWNGSTGLWETSVCQNSTLTYQMAAASGGSLVYEWQSSPDQSAWTSLPSSNSNTYAVATATIGTTYYRVLVTAVHQAFTEAKYSETVKVIVTPALTGVSATTGTFYVNSGASPSPFSVSYTGGGTVSFQWAQSPYGAATYSNIPGATAQTFTASPLSVNGSAIVGRTYQVTVSSATGCGGPVVAPSATVGWVPPVGTSSITSTQSAVVCSGNGGAGYPVAIATSGVGQSATLTSASPVSVTWQYRVNGGAWTTATQPANSDGTSNFSVPSSALTASGSNTTIVEVQAIVSGLVIQAGGAAGSATVSTPIYTIAINPQITITSQPSSPGNQCSGTTATISIGASGNGVTYQWQELSPDPGASWVNLSGQTSSSVSVPVLASPAALNDDPSFEIGISNVAKIAGSGSYSWDGTTIAAQGNRSVLTTGGAITLATPSASTVTVDTAQNYLILASVYSDTTAHTASIGLLCFDANGNPIAAQGAGDLALYRPLPSAKGVVVQSGGQTWQVLGGIVRGEGALLGTAGEPNTFRTGTKSIQVVADLEQGATTGNAHLDNVRILPLTTAEANLLVQNGGANIAAYAQARMGAVSDGQTTRSFQYRCVLGNPTACGGSAVISQTANVTAVPEPIFISVPADTTTCADSGNVSLIVNVAGGGSPTYQWQSSADGASNWLPISGANTVSYSFPAVNATASATSTFYRLQVVTTCGIATTRPIKVTINPSAAITTPISAPSTTCDGQTVTMTVGVRAGTVQWQQLNATTNVWSDIVGATGTSYSPTLALANPAVSELRTFRVVDTTTCNSVTSGSVSVTIQPGTAITAQTPASVTICQGGAAQIGVTAQGSNLTYAWSTAAAPSGPWSTVAGATGSTYSASPVPPVGGTITVYYQVKVQGGCGGSVQSQVFTVTANAPAAISTPLPSTLTLCSGTTKTIAVSTTGPAVSYAWTVTGPDGTTSPLSATGPSITVSSLASGPSLSPDPSFESGIGTLTRVSGASGSSLAWDSTTAANGTYSIRTSGGAIVMVKQGLIPVDPAVSYMLVGDIYGENASGATAILGVQCFDANSQPIAPSGTADTGLYRNLAEVNGVAMPASWTALGGLLTGTGAWNGGTAGPIPFRTGTRYVQLMVTLNVGSTAAIGHLDNLRLVPVTQAEISQLLSVATAKSLTLAQAWDLMMGGDASGTSTRTWTYTVQVQGACGSPVSSSSTVTMEPQPFFTSQPKDIQTCSGQPVAIAANLTAAGTPTFTWQSSSDQVTWQAIPGTNSATYSFTEPSTGAPPVTYYRLQAITDCGSLFTRVVTITVSPTPVITQNLSGPSNVCSGTPVTLNISASGGSSQFWEKSVNGGAWTVISTQIGSTYTDTPTATGNTPSTISYRTRIDSSCGEAVSSVVSVTVNPGTAINTQPIGFTSCLSGNSTALTVAASGSNLTYTWDQSTDNGTTWTQVAGATSFSYVPQPPANFTGSTWGAMFRVDVTGTCGVGVSQPVSVVLTTPPSITAQPVAPAPLCQSGSFTMSFTYTAASGATVQWQSGADGTTWAAIPGATSTNYGATITQSTWYRVAVINGCATVYTTPVQVVVQTPPAVTQQPVGGTYCSGDTLAASVTATGSNLTYQWQKNLGSGWVNLSASGSTLSYPLTNTGGSDLTISFQVIVSGTCGSPVTSNTFTVTIHPQAQIIQQPNPSQTICRNTSAVVSLLANGVTGYSWQMSANSGLTWTTIAGATGNSISTGNLAPGTYMYRAQLQGPCANGLFSQVAVVNVKPQATITQQPVSATICSGQGAVFTVASNLSDATYQWYTSTNAGGPWSTVTNGGLASLTLAPQTNLSGAPITTYYQAVVTPNGCDAPIASSAVSLTVKPGVNITAQPQSIAVCVNTAATMAVAATGDTLTYQWQMDSGSGFQNIAGATSPSVNLPTGTIGTFNVRVNVTGTCGTVPSTVAVLTVVGPTHITQQPTSTTTCEGNQVTFTVAAAGAQLTYKWEESTDGGATWTVVGTSSPSLSVIGTVNAMFRVTVYGGGGCTDSVVSNVVTLSVTQLPPQVPLVMPTYAIAGKNIYFSVAPGGPTYSTVSWTFAGQTQTGTGVVFLAPATPGTYQVVVTATSNSCQSSTTWNLSVVGAGNGDADQNGLIEGADIGRLEASFGLTAGAPGYDGVCDLNGDGVIDATDEALLIQRFGQAAPPAAIAGGGPVAPLEASTNTPADTTMKKTDTLGGANAAQ